MLKLSYHSKLRCAQRVFDVTNEQEARNFLSDKEDKVSFKLWEMLSKSSLIYENFSYDGTVTNNYYLYEDFLLVTDYPSKVFITLYKLKFDTEDIADSYLLNKHIKSINYNKNMMRRLAGKKILQDSRSRSIELAIEKLRNQIAELEIDLDESVGEAVTLKEGRRSLVLKNENIMKSIIKATDIDSSELRRREYSIR